MTKLQPLEKGDRAKFVRITYEGATVSPPIGANGTIVDDEGNGYLVLSLDEPAPCEWGTRTEYAVFRDELRKLPKRD